MFCQGILSLAPILEEAYSLKYDQEPNYNKLKYMIKIAMVDNGIKPF